MKTLYMTDLDGTLLGSDGKLSDFTKTTINALIERGLDFTVNTSRSPRSALAVISDLKLKLPGVFMNGSVFWNTQSGETEHLQCIHTAAAQSALSSCIRLGLEPLLFCYNEGEVALQYKSCNQDATCKFLNSRKHYYRSCDQVASFKVGKNTPYIICVGDFDKLQSAQKTLSLIAGVVVSVYGAEDYGFSFLEIYAEKAGKGTGLATYKKKYGFDKVVAFGDNLNDIPMFEAADYGVAVANGYIELKKIADLEIDSCDKDAVANYLMMEWARNPKLY